MDTDSWLLLVLLFTFILGGGYFASAETAFASSNIMKLKNKSGNGDRRAKNALYIMEHFEKALSTILIGNNIMHIGTASMSAYLVITLWGAGFVTYSTIVTTVVVFLISEMIPKQFAKDKPEFVALALAGSVRFFMKAFTPVSFIFDCISRLFKENSVPTVTEEELYDMVETFVEDGQMDKQRGRLICSAMEFDDTRVMEILTPRVSVVGVEINTSCDEILEIIRNTKFSRLPVYRETMDNIVGILSVRRFIKSYIKNGKETSISELIYEPYFVPKNKRIDDLFREITQSRVHMCVILDDYGGTMGIVTMEDILEELVGEIWDENDKVREDFICLGRNRYSVASGITVDNALRLIGFDDNDEILPPVTIGAWAQQNINNIPKKGSFFEYKRLRVSVLQINKRQHIQRLLLEITGGENS
jgi:CBS domain containing-hemolysin-like protein